MRVEHKTRFSTRFHGFYKGKAIFIFHLCLIMRYPEYGMKK